MTLKEAKKKFKTHYKKAMKLKEGGKAWEREINLAKRYLNIGITLYKIETKNKYIY